MNQQDRQSRLAANLRANLKRRKQRGQILADQQNLEPIMSKPHIAAKAPSQMQLEAGKAYFWCSCGQSKSQPFCDGSHKGSEFQPVRFSVEADKKAYLCNCKHSQKQPFCDGAHNKL